MSPGFDTQKRAYYRGSMKKPKLLLFIIFLTSILIPKTEAVTSTFFYSPCKSRVIVLESTWTRITRCDLSGYANLGPLTFPNDAVIEGVDLMQTLQFNGPITTKLGGAKGLTFASIIRGDYKIIFSSPGPALVFIHERK
jgi:hypothetical protein